jgi:hypothetical protein
MHPSVSVLRPADPRWDEWLRGVPHDFYHTAAYHAFSEADGQGAAYLAIYGTPDRYLAWPYLSNPVPGQERACDITSVYGYPGPLAAGCDTGDPFLAEAWAALCAHWRERGAVALFTRFHPLLDNQRWLDFSAGAPGVQSGGFTVSIDLTESPWEQLKPMWRRHIRRARSSGLVVEHDTDWRYLDAFVAHYRATMSRNGAQERYFFGREYVEGLRAALGGAVHLLVARAGQDPAAAILVSLHNGIAQYLYAGVNEAFQELSPLKLVLHEASLWAAAQGARVMHLGGGRASQDNDSLYFFKSGFSGRRHRFHSGRWVLDAQAYDTLCRKMLDRPAPSPQAGFFPAYREPAPVAVEARAS